MKIFVLVIFFFCRFEHFLYVRYDFYRDGFKKINLSVLLYLVRKAGEKRKIKTDILFNINGWFHIQFNEKNYFDWIF